LGNSGYQPPNVDLGYPPSGYPSHGNSGYPAAGQPQQSSSASSSKSGSNLGMATAAVGGALGKHYCLGRSVFMLS
jgi:hypothetical protein